MSPRVVFHSENGPGIGGSDLVMGCLASLAADQGWEVIALVRPDYPREQVFRDVPHVQLGDTRTANSYVATVQSARTRRRWKSVALACLPRPVARRLGYERTARRVAATLSNAGADLFVTMDGGPQPTVVGARRCGCAVVSIYSAFPATQIDEFGRAYSRKAACAADALVAPSACAARAWETYLGPKSFAVHAIPNGIPLPALDPTAGESLRRELRIPIRALVVGMTGRLEAQKGSQVLARAACPILRAFPNAVFVFTGSGTGLEALQKEFAESGLESQVRFTGWRSDAWRLPAVYDVAVVPSIEPETFGLVAAEAMAWGKPIVASDVGALPEVVGNCDSGVLVPAGNELRLAEAICALLASPNQRAALGRRGRERVEERFTLARMRAQYLGLFTRLLVARQT